MNSLKEKLQILPKADLHNHLTLGANINLLREKYGANLFDLPEKYDGFDGMMQFIETHVNSIMQNTSDFVGIMELAIESAIADNVTLLEASIDIKMAKYCNDSIEELNSAVGELRQRFATKIEFRPEIGIKKEYAISQIESDVLLCLHSGIYHGIDLYGKEQNKNLSDFRGLFQEARQCQLKTKVHIGEFFNDNSIDDAIEILQPHAIQHGIKAADSVRSMELIKEHDIQLNICPQSNVALGSVRNMEEHPIRILYDAGIPITINTDDLLLFNATITDQYLELIRLGMFTFEEIDKIRKQGLTC